MEIENAVNQANKELAKYKLSEHLESKLSKSGEARQVTTLFREAINLEEVRSAKEIDSKWDTFISAYRMGRDASGMGDIMINVEKRVEGEGQAGKGLDLSDCV